MIDYKITLSETGFNKEYFDKYPKIQYSLNINNGITLCKNCHDKILRKEYTVFNKYFNIVNGINKCHL